MDLIGNIHNDLQKGALQLVAEHRAALLTEARRLGCNETDAWGLYDMLGNVWEWCLDWNQDSPLGFDVATGPSSGSARVYRGGSWYGAAYYCRCAARYSLVPSGQYYNVGFRLACPAEAK